MAAESPGKEITGYAAFSAAVAITALVSIGSSCAFAKFDSTFSARLQNLFDTQSGSVTAASFATRFGSESLIANLIIILVFFSVVACLVGKLSAVPRLISCLQLFAISLLVQWAMFATALQPRSTAIFVSIVFGCASGYLLRLRQIGRDKKQSQSSELKLRYRELQEARLQMVKQDETDRRLLAADLHDQVLNDLKILNQKIRSNRVQLIAGSSAVNDGETAEIYNLLQQTMNGVRDVMDNLSPATLEHLGFGAALEDCLKRASERSGGFKIRYKNNSGASDFSELNLIEQTLLYRIVQECGTNICKHAQATIVKLTLEQNEGELLIRVADNGKGMPEGGAISDSRGVQYMRQRGDLIGATIVWIPGEHNKGTTVEIRMPIVRQ